MVYLISINYKWCLSVYQAFCESYTCIIPMVGAWADARGPNCGHGSILLRWAEVVVVKIETQQQSGWARCGGVGGEGGRGGIETSL